MDILKHEERMMLRKLCILLLCFTAVGCKKQKEKVEWKRYDNSMYSIELPSHFMYNDGEEYSYHPMFRDLKEMREYRGRWSITPCSIKIDDPIPTEEERNNNILVTIRVMEFKDVSARFDMEKEIKRYLTIFKKVESCDKTYNSADEKRYILRILSRSISGGNVTLIPAVRYILYKENGNMQYRIEVHIEEQNLKKHPEYQESINRILNSFTLK